MVTTPGNRSYADATEKLRSAAKWLMTAAAGVGGVLVAGLQLGSLGELSLDHWQRLVIAVAGLALALGGVAVVVAHAGRLLTEDWITLGELSVEDFESRLNRKEDKFRKGDVATIYADITSYGEELYGRVATSPEQLYHLLCEANRRARDIGGPSTTPASAAGVGDSEIREAVNAVVEFANYRRTRADFERLQRVLAIATAAVLAGIVAFAIAAHAPEKGGDNHPGSTPTSQTK